MGILGVVKGILGAGEIDDIFDYLPISPFLVNDSIVR
jgi:hypothetical protein